MNKVTKFLQFTTEYKLPSLTKHMTDDQLKDLYYKYFPQLKNSTNIQQKAISNLVLIAIVEELRKRHPSNSQLANWNYEDELDLQDIGG